MSGMFGMQLVISVGLSFIGIFASVIMIFFGAGGWGFVVAVWMLLNSMTGWKALNQGIGKLGARNNGERAYAMSIFTNLLVGAGMLQSPPHYSSLWGILAPVAFLVTSLATVLIYEWMLDIADPKGKKSALE